MSGNCAGDRREERSRTRRDRSHTRRVLLDTLRVSEEEQLVLKDRTANAATKLVALELRILAVLGARKQSTVILKVVKELAVDACWFRSWWTQVPDRWRLPRQTHPAWNG